MDGNGVYRDLGQIGAVFAIVPLAESAKFNVCCLRLEVIQCAALAPAQNLWLIERISMPSLFKTLGVVLCLAFALCFVAPNAAADEFVYTYTITSNPSVYGGTFTTNPMAAVTAQVLILAADLASFSVTGSFYNPGLQFLTLDRLNQGYQAVGVPGNGVNLPDGFTLSDYSTPGTYTSLVTGNTLTVTDVTATPEPSSLALMLSGVGLVFAMRKRWGFSQAS